MTWLNGITTIKLIIFLLLTVDVILTPVNVPGVLPKVGMLWSSSGSLLLILQLRLSTFNKWWVRVTQMTWMLFGGLKPEELFPVMQGVFVRIPISAVIDLGCECHRYPNKHKFQVSN